MKLIRLLIVLIGVSGIFQPKQAQAQIDTVFWFAAPWVTPDHWWRDPIAFHFSTFNNPTTIRIQQPASTYDTTFTVPANSLFSKYVDFMMDSLESKPANAILRTGFKITSDFPITVVYDVITRPANNYNPETYSLKGTNGIGTEFVTPFQTLWNNRTLGGDLNGDGQVTQPKQQFSIVATEDSTTVYITPRCAVVGGHPANVTYSVFLPQKGNVYTCENLVQNTSAAGNSLAGSIVVANKPVSVTVTDDSVNPSGGGGCYDLMGDQIVPVDVIGNNYIIERGQLNAGSNESVFITATQNFTTVTIDNGVTTTTATMNRGDTYQYSITQQLTYVSTDKPVYLLHMSGYGCELGEALLPPLNCAGSDQVVFARSNAQNFVLNIICENGDQGNFQLNGNPALIPAGAFTVVPGTGGQYVGAQISFSTAQIPVGTANLVTNSSGLFALGVFNGGPTTGCLYHYLSSFIRRVFTEAGNDVTLCTGSPSVSLNGSVTGGATTGIWTVLNGSGTIANPTGLSTTYTPTSSDFAQGVVTFVLTSTGNCQPVSDTVKATFNQSPVVNAGNDLTFCKNNISPITLGGAVQFAAGASWSGGNGGVFGNSGDLNTTYTPAPGDLSNDSILIVLTSAGSFFACPDDVDSMVIYLTEPPSVNPGADQVLCTSQTQLTLNGSVTGTSTSGVWTTNGSGAFSPSGNQLNTTYLINPADTTAGSITLYLTSTNNGNCNAVQDSLQITFLSRPEVDITSDDTLCANIPNLSLSGVLSSGFTGTWSTNGAGTIANPNNLNTQYFVSPVDTAAGNIQIYLTSNAGICPSVTDTLFLVFATPPRANAGLDQDYCDNQTIPLNGIIAGGTTTVVWSSTGTGTFNPGNNFVNTTYQPSPLDVSNGTVQLILTSTNNQGCNPDDDTLLVTFKPSPSANFTNTTECQNDNTQFTDLSTTPSGTINSWSWDFGDFTNSITNNPVHPYSASGTFTVSLIAGSSNGCFDTIQQQVTVHPLPTADFTFNFPCENTPVQFSDQTFISSGSVVAWEYDFGDGSSPSIQQNPVHTFPGLGTFNVSLQAISSFGCIDTIILPVTISPSPTAAFTVSNNPVVALENIDFTDISSGGVIVDWYWNFGDSTGNNVQNPSHSYANGGVYPVTLVIFDANGCTDTVKTEIIVALLPVLPTAFTPNGDGDNDEFIVRGGPFDTLSFNIYNSWGQLIFSSDDQSKGWDGSFQGTDQPVGVYTWTLEVQIVDGRIIKKTGDVTLLR